VATKHALSARAHSQRRSSRQQHRLKLGLDIEAFILIGGRSERFGSDKAFFDFEGESLAERAAKTVEEAFPGVRVTFVAASPEQFGSKLRVLRREVIFDRRTGLGAWSGMDAALRDSHKEWTLVIATDLPFISPQFLRDLYKNADQSADAVVPRSEGRLQPLCAFYRTEVFRERIAGRLAASGKISPLTSMITAVRSRIIDVPADELRNVNTPEDMKE